MYAPTALKVGSLGDGPSGNLLSIDRVNTKDFFVTDQYTVGRATFNLGLRYDNYDVLMPDQTQLAYTFPTGLSIPAASCATSPAFCETHFVQWNSFVPRLGMTYDLLGTGKTVLKFNYGMYRFNPGVGVAASANPNQATKSVTYAWTDTKVCATCKPGDGLYQAGEETSSTPTGSGAGRHDHGRSEHQAAVLAPGDRVPRAAADRRRRRARRASSTTRSRTRPARSSRSSGERLHRAVQRRRSGPGRRHRHGRRPEPDGVRHSDQAAPPQTSSQDRRTWSVTRRTTAPTRPSSSR